MSEVTPQELEAIINNPPRLLAPMAGMMKNLKVNGDKATADLAGAEYTLVQAQENVDRLRAAVKSIADQRNVMSEAFRHSVIAYKAPVDEPADLVEPAPPAAS